MKKNNTKTIFYMILSALSLCCLILFMSCIRQVAAAECEHNDGTYECNCSVMGVKQIHCAICHETLEIIEGVEFSESIHNPRNMVEVMEATCAKDGCTFAECTICHYPVIFDYVPATNEHNLVPEENSCSFRCTTCDDLFYNYDVTSPYHKPNKEGVTCTEGNYCIYCNLELNGPLGHSPITINCVENRYCSRCYISMEVDSHSMNNGICTICGYSEAKPINNEKEDVVVTSNLFIYLKEIIFNFIKKLFYIFFK